MPDSLAGKVLTQSLGESILKDKEPFTSLNDGFKSAITVFAVEAERTGEVFSLAPY